MLAFNIIYDYYPLKVSDREVVLVCVLVFIPIGILTLSIFMLFIFHCYLILVEEKTTRELLKHKNTKQLDPDEYEHP